ADPDQARFFTSNNLAVARDRFRAIGGFDASFGAAAAEDREFCDRWLAHGHRMIYAADAIVSHVHPLTFRTFCQHHFWYGRCAFWFRRVRVRRGAGRVQVQSPPFYWKPLRDAAALDRRPRAPRV